MQCDELWSFVDNKGNKQWVWLALDADTREIVGVYIGARDEAAAAQLWASLPPIYRQCAVAYTDFWAAYAAVFPSKRHQAVGKETGLTSYVERFNNTLRQRVSRLVRKTLSFSKSLENHIGAIWYFIHHYFFSTTHKYYSMRKYHVNLLRFLQCIPYQDFPLRMTQELEAQALAILDSLVSVPFDQCIPITRSLTNVTANATIYAVRHREFGLLYVGKTRYTRERFRDGHKAFL